VVGSGTADDENGERRNGLTCNELSIYFFPTPTMFPLLLISAKCMIDSHSLSPEIVSESKPFISVPS